MKGDTIMYEHLNKSNEELIQIIQETADEEACKQLFRNLRPIIIHEAEMFKGRISHYDLEDYIQEGNMLAWKIIAAGYFKGPKFAPYFTKAVKNLFFRIYRDFTLKNLICIGQKEDDNGTIISILVEADYAKAYREKERERVKAYNERKKIEVAEARRAAGIPEPVKKQPMTKEERLRKAREYCKQYYATHPEKLEERRAKMRVYEKERRQRIKMEKIMAAFTPTIE